MRLVIISDIHSNLQALEAVISDIMNIEPDQVVVAGDMINRGPQPREVMTLLDTYNWPMLRGNHEDYVVAQRNATPDDILETPIWQPARWTAEQVSEWIDLFEALPIAMELLAPDGSSVLVAHASPRHNRDGVYRFTSDDELREMMGQNPPPLFCSGHTHQPLVRQVDSTLVVNVGAVGMPFNGDWRAQYGLLTWTPEGWQAELRAVPYDREAALLAYEQSGFLAGGGPLAYIIREELVSSLPQLGPWFNLFSDRVRAGEISVEEAVEQYFALPADTIERF